MTKSALIKQLEQTNGLLKEDIQSLWLIYDEYFIYINPKEDMNMYYSKIQSEIITLLKSMQYNRNLTKRTIDTYYRVTNKRR